MVGLLFGVDIGGTNIKAALVSPQGEPVVFASHAWSGRAASDAAATIGALLTRLKDSHDRAEVDGCGVASAGFVDVAAGIVHVSPNLPEWHDVELRRMVSETTGLRVNVENDANAAAFAEHTLGAARGALNSVTLTLGTGLGAGIVLGGRLYRGAGFAGEVGHTTVDLNGAVCACGNAGCLESLTNAAAVVRAAERILAIGRPSSLDAAKGLTAELVGEAASSGDAVGIEALAEVGRALGVGLANLALVLDPDVFVIGGGVAAAGEPLLAPAREEMKRRVYCAGPALPRVEPAALGNAAGVIGAALLAREALQGD